jgi:hypothetical protein
MARTAGLNPHRPAAAPGSGAPTHHGARSLELVARPRGRRSDDDDGNVCPGCGPVTGGRSSRYCAAHMRRLRDTWRQWRQTVQEAANAADPR